MKELKKITWYSKLLTLIAMLVFMGVGFMIGILYQADQVDNETALMRGNT